MRRPAARNHRSQTGAIRAKPEQRPSRTRRPAARNHRSQTGAVRQRLNRGRQRRGSRRHATIAVKRGQSGERLNKGLLRTRLAARNHRSQRGQSGSAEQTRLKTRRPAALTIAVNLAAVRATPEHVRMTWLAARNRRSQTAAVRATPEQRPSRTRRPAAPTVRQSTNGGSPATPEERPLGRGGWRHATIAVKRGQSGERRTEAVRRGGRRHATIAIKRRQSGQRLNRGRQGVAAGGTQPSQSNGGQSGQRLNRGASRTRRPAARNHRNRTAAIRATPEQRPSKTRRPAERNHCIQTAAIPATPNRRAQGRGGRHATIAVKRGQPRKCILRNIHCR